MSVTDLYDGQASIELIDGGAIVLSITENASDTKQSLYLTPHQAKSLAYQILACAYEES